MKITCLTFLILCIITLPSCSQKIQDKNQSSYNKVVSEIDSLMNESRHEDFRGSVLVSKNNRAIFNKSYGKQISNPNTAFWIGSMTKSFTATAILKLQEEKKLSVHDSLKKFIQNVPKDKVGITIHHLLTHSSGLADNYIVDGITNRNQAISTILSSKLEHKIGEKHSYSAEGYNLLAIIVELVSEKSYEKYITESILVPAKLNNTGFWGFETQSADHLAQWNKPELMKNFMPTIINNGISQSNYGFKGATGMFSTTEDLSKWVNALRASKIVNSEGLNQMLRPYTSARGDLQNGVFYGYGWYLEHKNGTLREIRHGGAEDGGIGHNGIIRFYENGDQIIVLSNSGVYNGAGRLNGVEWGIVLSFDLRDITEAN